MNDAMQEKLTLGVDIDGVIAKFNEGFAHLLIELTGKTLGGLNPKRVDPQVWEWPSLLGYSADEQRAAWKYIELDPMFWRSLGDMPHTAEFLSRLWMSPHDVYFITSRPGLSAKRQTEVWLTRYYKNPTVLITASKGLACKTLLVDAYIDDKYENCIDVIESGARTYMLRTGYNGHAPLVKELNIVDSILTFLERESC